MSGAGTLSSELLWRASLVAALLDAPLLFLVARGISSGLFRQLKWYLVGAAFFIYALLWGLNGSLFFWDTVYRAIFPAWSRWLLPAGFGVLFAAFALAFWRMSLFAARWPALWFSLLGGLVSLLGHSIGISRGLLRVPLLAQVSLLSTLTFGIFEFIFYWCAILVLGLAARWLSRRLRHKPG